MVPGEKMQVFNKVRKSLYQKISHVDMYDKAFFFGLVKRRTIKVYGEYNYRLFIFFRGAHRSSFYNNTILPV